MTSYESLSYPAHFKRQLLWQRLRTVLIKEDGGKTSSCRTTSELILRMVEQNPMEVNLNVRRGLASPGCTFLYTLLVGILIRHFKDFSGCTHACEHCFSILRV